MTIAIPTFNRHCYLKELLDSIVPQINDRVEVLIKDNASTDDTQNIAMEYLLKYPFIRYSRNSENIGPDANFLKCFKESSGKFVHLLSDDDILLPGAVSNIIRLIDSNDDIAIIRTNCCAFNRTFIINGCCEPAYKITGDILFNDKNRFLEYIGYSSIFMSTTIYNKKKLLTITNPERHIGTNLLQTHLIFECMAKGGKGVVMSSTCVAARVGMPVGFNLYRVLVVEWKKVLFSTCLSLGYDPSSLRKVYNQSISENLSKIVSDAHLIEERYGTVFFSIFRDTWQFPLAWIYLYPFSLLPSNLLRLLAALKKRIKKYTCLAFGCE